tara:strand:- start:271 stop:501 length:231 start_codon:yes stop_codon:yes gene_type:complete
MLNKRILFGEQHLRRTLNSFVDHHHQDRPHQSLGNKPIAPTNDEPPNGGRVVVDERLGSDATAAAPRSKWGNEVHH